MTNTRLFPNIKTDAPTYTTGTLPSQDIQALIEAGQLTASSQILEEQIQPCSIDLRLGMEAFRLRSSFLPGPRATVQTKLTALCMHVMDLSKPTVLERGCVYVVPLMEEVYLPPLISGKANPKSTTGRLDVFTRLMSDYGTEFERVPAGYKGKLYLEIVPRTFSILVQAGFKLHQLRFLRGNPPPSDAKLGKIAREESLLYLSQGDDGADLPKMPFISDGLWVSIDLKGQNIIGYRAKQHAPLIDLSKYRYYDPGDFWEPIYAANPPHLILNPGDFYILSSKEKTRVPPDFGAEMVAYHLSVGEFRIHYAGFFDPGFGYGNGEITGTKAVLEVRSHEVPFLLEDGQQVGRLVYERLLRRPEKLYGSGIGSSYQYQGISLSKQFKPWPI